MNLGISTAAAFQEKEKLISGQTETTGISLINFQDLKVCIDKLIAQSSLSNATAKVNIYSDSVLCLEKKMENNPIQSWKKQIQWYSNNLFKDMSRIDGKPWSSSGRFHRDSRQRASSRRFRE